MKPMGGGVSKVDVADMHKAVLAVLKRGPLDDSIRLLKQNANIRYREEHGHNGARLSCRAASL